MKIRSLPILDFDLYIAEKRIEGMDKLITLLNDRCLEMRRELDALKTKNK